MPLGPSDTPPLQTRPSDWGDRGCRRRLWERLHDEQVGCGPAARPRRSHHVRPPGIAAHHQSHEVNRDRASTALDVLALALVAQILVVLDISVVNTALPTIGESLDLQGSDLQWMVTAYLLMSGGGLLLGGRIADLLPVAGSS